MWSRLRLEPHQSLAHSNSSRVAIDIWGDKTAVAPTPWGTGDVPLHFYKWQGTGATWVENSKQETDQAVLTITKELTKTTNCTFRTKKMEGHDPKKFPAPTFKFLLVPLNRNNFIPII